MIKRKRLKLEIGKSYRLRPINNPWNMEKPFQTFETGGKNSIKKVAQYYHNLDDSKVYCLISSLSFIRKINNSLESNETVSNPIFCFDVIGKDVEVDIDDVRTYMDYENIKVESGDEMEMSSDEMQELFKDIKTLDNYILEYKGIN